MAAVPSGLNCFVGCHSTFRLKISWTWTPRETVRPLPPILPPLHNKLNTCTPWPKPQDLPQCHIFLIDCRPKNPNTVSAGLWRNG
jgi:hypothetical protein